MPLDAPDAPPRSPRQFNLGCGRGFVIAVLCLVGIVIALSYSVRNARRAALRSQSNGPLNQVSLALHNYHDPHGCFPPAYVCDATGRRIHSWRALLIPYLPDFGDAVARYDMDEPWDGPNNSKLHHMMPGTFRAATEPESKTFTTVVVVTGPETAFPGTESVSLSDITDGVENTVLITEITNSDICYLEPRDLDFNAMSFVPGDPEKPSISCVEWRNPFVVFGDSIRCYPVDKSIAPGELRALLTISGSDGKTRQQLIAAGRFRNK